MVQMFLTLQQAFVEVVERVAGNLKLSEKVVGKWKLALIPSNTRGFYVNYKQLFLLVCKESFRYAIKSKDGPGNLDIICRPWALVKESATLPSWVPSLSGASFGPSLDRNAAGGWRMSRINVDPLVGEPGTGRAPYNASRRKAGQADWRFGDGGTANIASLFVRGFVLDVIKETEHSSLMGIIPQEWFELAGWPEGSPPPERFWRTLVADRNPGGLDAPVVYPLVCEYARSCSTSDGINTRELIENGRCEPMADFL